MHENYQILTINTEIMDGGIFMQIVLSCCFQDTASWPGYSRHIPTPFLDLITTP